MTDDQRSVTEGGTVMVCVTLTGQLGRSVLVGLTSIIGTGKVIGCDVILHDLFPLKLRQQTLNQYRLQYYSQTLQLIQQTIVFTLQQMETVFLRQMRRSLCH